MQPQDPNFDRPESPTGPVTPRGGAGDDDANATPGEVIGAYTLICKIGEGAFGVVWLAERTEPFLQRVAIKVVKAGMDSKGVVARFEQERQSLALMDHPNIARIFDGGTTVPAMGSRPYFVMEYVSGEPITDFCDRRSIGIPERLKLFASVCAAVHHAHGRGIIHRDLKPGNILVQEIEGLEADSGLVKVIDFGIAKALSAPSNRASLNTEVGAMVGTPEYMSPEQAEAMGLGGPAGAAVDRRSDVYSLGVVLYELLSGRMPFDTETVRGGGLQQTLRIVCHTDPPSPSERVRSLEESERTRVAQARGMLADELVGTLRRELECIPMMAMRKETTRRYQTAQVLQDDVQRAIEGRVLKAGPESVGYRLRKELVRSLGVRGCAVAAWLIASVLGLGVALWAPMGFSGVLVQEARLWLFPLKLDAGLPFEQVRIVRMTGKTDLPQLLKREFIAGDPLEMATKRLLHARLLERLSRAGVRAVAFDICFQKASEFDSFLGGKADLRPNADVVFGTELWGGTWVTGGSGLRPARVGTPVTNIAPSGDVDIGLVCIDKAGHAVGLSLPLQTLAAAMAPTSRTTMTRQGESRMLMHLETGTRSPVLIDTSGFVLLEKPELGAKPGDSISYFPTYVVPDALIDEASIEYADACGSTPAQFQERFAGKVVVIADDTSGLDRHVIGNGRKVGGYAIQSQGIESLMQSFAWRERWWADAMMVLSSAAVAVCGCMSRIRRPIVVVLLAIVGAGALLGAAVILQRFMVLLSPIGPLCGMLVASSAVGWLRLGQPNTGAHA